jgi:hypothetical protein
MQGDQLQQVEFYCLFLKIILYRFGFNIDIKFCMIKIKDFEDFG